MSSTTFGIIDIGSNTIRMNIYQISDSSFKVIMSNKVAAGLVSYVQKGSMSPQGIKKLEEVLLEFKEILDLLHVDNYAVFATASLRNIDNSAQVIEAIHTRCNIPIDLLSGSQEGRLSFLGALNGLVHEDGMYIDTGGGSTEVVVYNDHEIDFVASMPIGSLNLYNRYVKEIIPTPAEAQKIRQRVEKELQAISPSKTYFRCSHLSVTGGSMRAVRQLLIALKWIRPDQYDIKPALLHELCEYLEKDETRTIRLFIKEKPDRVHTLYTGLLIVDTIAQKIQAQVIQVSVNGVREGYLAEKIIKKEDYE